MKYILPVNIRGTIEKFIVEYEKGLSAQKAGFDALVGFPVDKINCIGYPTMHGYFEQMKLTGYRRYCGIIQLVERTEYAEDGKIELVDLTFDIPECEGKSINPYFAYGYPVEIYDAPCFNLRDSHKIKWKAYTYLVDPPSRLNNNQLTFFAGYSWGYYEDKKGPVEMLPFEKLSVALFKEQMQLLDKRYREIIW